jgi:hypothetical protein
VTRHVEKREIPEPLVRESHTRFGLFDLERCSLANRLQQIRQTRWIRVLVAAAVVLQTRDGEARPHR